MRLSFKHQHQALVAGAGTQHKPTLMSAAHDFGKHQTRDLLQCSAALGQAQPTPRSLGFEQVHQQDKDHAADRGVNSGVCGHDHAALRRTQPANTWTPTLERVRAWLLLFIFWPAWHLQIQHPWWPIQENPSASIDHSMACKHLGGRSHNWPWQHHLSDPNAARGRCW